MLAEGGGGQGELQEDTQAPNPKSRRQPHGKAERDAADSDNGPVALAKARMGGGLWCLGCVHRYESVQKGEAAGGAGEGPADQKLRRWGPAVCFHTLCR